MEWEEAVEKAKEELGYGDEYIEDWDEVVDLAKQILADEACDDYQKYLLSDEWRALREKALKGMDINAGIVESTQTAFITPATIIFTCPRR